MSSYWATNASRAGDSIFPSVQLSDPHLASAQESCRGAFKESRFPGPSSNLIRISEGLAQTPIFVKLHPQVILMCRQQ